MQLSLTNHQCPNIILNQIISEKTQIIGLKTWSKLEKQWNLQESSTGRPHNLGVFFFGLVTFKGCNRHLWITLAMNFGFSKNFQDNF